MRTQAQLPLRMGGLGLTSGDAIKECAYVASFGDAASALANNSKGQAVRTLYATKLRHTNTRGGNKANSATSSAASSPMPSSAPASPGAVETTPPRQRRSVQELLDGLHKRWAEYGHVPDVNDAISSAPLTLDDLLRPRAKAGTKHGDGLQRRLTSVQQHIDIHKLKNKSTEACARLTSLAQKPASAFFQAIPSEPALRSSNDTFALKVAMTLGCPAIPNLSHKQADRCTAKRCGPKCVSPDQHILNCPTNGATQRRHDAVKDETFQMFRAAKLSTNLEQRNIEDETNQRPDMTVMNLKPHTVSFVEVSVTNPVSATATMSTAAKPLRSGERRAYEKQRKYERLASTTKSENLQAILETTGAMCKSFRELIKKVEAKATARCDAGGLPPTVTWAANTFSKYWTQRIAFALANSIEAGATSHAQSTGVGHVRARTCPQ
jgi:hypothetical protein